MFDFLRKKIKSWTEKEEKATSKSKKDIKPKKETKSKSQKKSTKKEIKVDVNKKLIKKDKIELEIPERIKEKKKEKEVHEIEEEISDEPTFEESEEITKTPKSKFSLWPFGKKKEKEETIEEKEELEEEKTESEKEEIEEEKVEGNFFSKLVKKISAAKLSQEDFDDIFQELEITLLENNVALEAVDKIRESLAKSLVGQDIKKQNIEEKIIDSLKDSILSLLIEPPNLIEQIKSHKGIFTILFFGINGTGKTTSIAKLAYQLKKQGISVVLAAGDTFRAASIEQLKTHADKIGVPIVASSYGADPASVAFDAKKYAEKNNIKVVLIDTAGRMYTKENLLKEMEKIIRVSKPDLKIFVGESITGNDAVDQARTFNDTAGIDGIILSKADIDEKAGTILSVSYITGKPIYFLGTGQEYDDLTPFTKKEVIKNLGLE